MIKIGKKFRFSAAHRLPFHDGKCKRDHGHNYEVTVEIEGPMREGFTEERPDYGMIMDYKKLDDIVNERIIEDLDHTVLNDYISYPTAEYILLWIVNRLKFVINKGSLRLHRVILKESDDTTATWEA